MLESFSGGKSGSDTQKNAHGISSLTKESPSEPRAIQIPEISLPKGGGAIKGIEEKFQVNAVNGTASFSIPIPVSPSRQDFHPQLALSYNSGAGNSPFGLGWSMDVPSITRKTEKQIPQYRDDEEFDTFILAGAEDLVPFLKQNGATWKRIEKDRTESGTSYRVIRYRPRIEGSFARIEKWVNKSTGDMHWRSISRDNVTSFFGVDPKSRIANPQDPSQVFSWLLSHTFDDKGNFILYEYKPEDFKGVDNRIFEKNKINNCTNIYLKRILYGNKTPYQNGAPVPSGDDFLFQIVLDYGEHENAGLDILNDSAKIDDRTPVSIHQEPNTWEYRKDSFSNFRAGFEIRTYRRCKRVMLFHVFDELEVKPYLVRSSELHYDENLEFTGLGKKDTGFSYLTKVIQKGHKLNTSKTHYLSKALPPFEFTYEQHAWNTELKEVSADHISDAPVGINNSRHQWIDLYSEGISGILSEHSNGWFYKSNLGDGQFTPAKQVSPKPSFSGVANGSLAIQDLEGNGKKYAVNYSTEPKGYFPLTPDEEWNPFSSFPNLPNRNFNDPNSKFLDLNGDGKPDLIISEDEAFFWYAAKGEKGFEEGGSVHKVIDEEKGPVVVFADSTQSIFLADMTGDGLTDIVRIRNGDICYWANVGYGRFSPKVSMENAPLLDHPDTFAPGFIRLADIDGSGTTDLIYLGKNEFQVWMNQNGNSWEEEAKIVNPFPGINSQVDISILDFLGTGTSCIVWSSPLPGDASRPLRYIDLMESKKPHLLIKFQNNYGKEVSLEYKPSTHFYLKDKDGENPWITKLPFPVHVLTKTEIRDHVSQSRFVSEYSYHHGYYDHDEREFRGFGRVDQLDTEDYEHFRRNTAGNIVSADLHQDPVLTKTWFHTGAFLNNQKILKQFSHEYFQNEKFEEHYLPEARIVLPDGMTMDDLSSFEYREALRACKSMTLRQEVYAVDGSAKTEHPYMAGVHNCHIRLLQPRGDNKYAVFLVTESEQITFQYEREVSDPRIAHNINLETDDLGNILKAASVVYPRATSNPRFSSEIRAEIQSLPAEAKAEQERLHILLTENNFTGDIDTETDYRLRVPSEVQTFELTGITPSNDFFNLEELHVAALNAVPIQYHSNPASGIVEKRIIEHMRTLYSKDDVSGALPLGQLESKGLSYESYQLAFTKALVDDIYNGKVTEGILRNGKYLKSEDLKAAGHFPDSDNSDEWWIASGRAGYPSDPASHFYLPDKFIDPFGEITKVSYDSSYHIFIRSIEDPLNNKTSVEKLNYRVLAPELMKDLNENLAEVRFDILGMVTGTAIKGKGDEADNFQGFQEDLAANEIEAFFNDPEGEGKELLKNATIRFIYDFQQTPVWAGTIAREHHAKDVQNGAPDTRQYTFEYSNGMGQVLMKKVQAEPGKACKIDDNGKKITVDTAPGLRWVGTGRTILNNKGNPIKRYEPYFSTTHKFEEDQRLVECGVTPIMYYDAQGRLVKTEFPDNTLSKIEFDSWKQVVYDQNDTIKDSQWYDDRVNSRIDAELAAEGRDPTQEKEAAKKTENHYDTPNEIHLDSLGRPVLYVEHNLNQNGTEEFYNTFIKFDIEGNVVWIFDACDKTQRDDSGGNRVMEYKYDMLGHRVYQNSMDAGRRWTFNNVAGNEIKKWDERNHEFSFTYDKLQRPVESRVKGGDGDSPLNNIFEKIIYGEGQTDDKKFNLRGQISGHYDTAGQLEFEYDFKGNVTKKNRRLSKNYKKVVNWSGGNLHNKLEAETFHSVFHYDALNRTTSSRTPDDSLTEFTYNEAGLLNTVKVTQNSTATTFVKNIKYDAKGQRISIIYGNDIQTMYTYDKETFRLIHLRTQKKNGKPLQDLYYTFDPIGNITHIRDKSIPTVFFNNQMIEGISKYTYDPLYRLIEAEGREHAGQQINFGQHDNWKDLPFLKQYGQGDSMAWRKYTQSYEYDSVGNIMKMQHTAAGGGWSRDYEYEASSNRLKKTTVGSRTYSYHPQHGFIVAMPHLQVMKWNFREELQAIASQSRTDGGTPETTYYVYDAGGQRVRKVTENSANPGVVPTKKEERIYLGGYEVYRKHSGTHAGLERQTLHVMDDTRRIAFVEHRNDVDDGSPKRLARYQFSNHLGSACLETDDSSNPRVISYEEYHPYGTTSHQAVDKDINAARKHYRYTGKERDEESGFYYHGARYYVAWLGRWTSCDPIGLMDGINLYLYVRNNPVRYSDPAGTKSIEESIEEIESPIGWFFARTGYDLWNVVSLGTLSKVEAQENLGTLEGLGESGFAGAKSISNAASLGLQDRIYETQMKEGPGLQSIGKGVIGAGKDMLPIEEASILANPDASAAEKWRAGGMAVSKTANLFALGTATTGKAVTLPRAKGMGTHPNSLPVKRIQAINQKHALKGKLRKTEPPKNIKQRRIYEKTHGKLDKQFQPDHVIEMQLGGPPKAVTNLAPLDATINASVGARIQWQIRSHRIGQRYDRVLIEGQRVPVPDAFGVFLSIQATSTTAQRDQLQDEMVIDLPDSGMEVKIMHPKPTINQ